MKVFKHTPYHFLFLNLFCSLPAKRYEINHISCLETICEYNQKTISCGEGEVIEIFAAFWGRNDKTTCPNN